MSYARALATGSLSAVRAKSDKREDDEFSYDRRHKKSSTSSMKAALAQSHNIIRAKGVVPYMDGLPGGPGKRGAGPKTSPRGVQSRRQRISEGGSSNANDAHVLEQYDPMGLMDAATIASRVPGGVGVALEDGDLVEDGFDILGRGPSNEPGLGGMSEMAELNNILAANTASAEIDEDVEMQNWERNRRILRSLMEKWADGYGQEQEQFTSLYNYAAFLMREARSATWGMGSPNPLRTAVACHLLDTIQQLFGRYRPLLVAVQREIMASVYGEWSSRDKPRVTDTTIATAGGKSEPLVVGFTARGAPQSANTAETPDPSGRSLRELLHCTPFYEEERRLLHARRKYEHQSVKFNEDWMRQHRVLQFSIRVWQTALMERIFVAWKNTTRRSRRGIIAQENYFSARRRRITRYWSAWREFVARQATVKAETEAEARSMQFKEQTETVSWLEKTFKDSLTELSDKDATLHDLENKLSKVVGAARVYGQLCAIMSNNAPGAVLPLIPRSLLLDLVAGMDTVLHPNEDAFSRPPMVQTLSVMQISVPKEAPGGSLLQRQVQMAKETERHACFIRGLLAWVNMHLRKTTAVTEDVVDFDEDEFEGEREQATTPTITSAGLGSGSASASDGAAAGRPPSRDGSKKVTIKGGKSRKTKKKSALKRQQSGLGLTKDLKGKGKPPTAKRPAATGAQEEQRPSSPADSKPGGDPTEKADEKTKGDHKGEKVPTPVQLDWLDPMAVCLSSMPHRIENFADDVRDSRAYLTLFYSVAPNTLPDELYELMSESDLRKRGEYVLQAAESLGVRTMISSNDIVNGVADLNLHFAASIFQALCLLSRKRALELGVRGIVLAEPVTEQCELEKFNAELFNDILSKQVVDQWGTKKATSGFAVTSKPVASSPVPPDEVPQPSEGSAAKEPQQDSKDSGKVEDRTGAEADAGSEAAPDDLADEKPKDLIVEDSSMALALSAHQTTMMNSAASQALLSSEARRSALLASRTGGQAFMSDAKQVKEFERFTRIQANHLQAIDFDAKVEDVSSVLKSSFVELKRIYQYYAASVGAGGGYLSMSLSEFWRFVQDCRFTKSGGGDGTLKRMGQKALTKAEIAHIFNRVLKLRSKEEFDNQEEPPSPDDILPHEFAECLIRIAAARYPNRDNFGTLAERLVLLLQNSVLPHAAQSRVDAFRQELVRPEVQTVFKKNKILLQKVFRYYGTETKNTEPDAPEVVAMGVPVDDADAAQDSLVASVSMTLKQYLVFGKECKLVEAGLTAKDMEVIFCHVQHEEDPADAEFIFVEFLEAVAAMAIYRHPSPFLPLEDRLQKFFKDQLLSGLPTKLRSAVSKAQMRRQKSMKRLQVAQQPSLLGVPQSDSNLRSMSLAAGLDAGAPPSSPASMHRQDTLVMTSSNSGSMLK